LGERFVDSLHRQRQPEHNRRPVGEAFADGVIDEWPVDGDAVPYRAAFAALQGIADLITATMVFHRADIGLGVGQDAAIGRDDGDAGAAFGGVENPAVQDRNLVRSLRRKRSYRKRVNADQADERLKFVVSVIFVAGAEGAFGEKIHGQQGARKECQEGEREIPKKFTPHVSRTDSLRRGQSSGAGDFPGQIQSFRAGGAHRRPRCGA